MSAGKKYFIPTWLKKPYNDFKRNGRGLSENKNFGNWIGHRFKIYSNSPSLCLHYQKTCNDRKERVLELLDDFCYISLS